MRADSASAVTIAPARRVAGRVRVPGDKSISHRYALLAALAEGLTTIDGYAPGADCAATLSCLWRLGVQVSRTLGASVARPSADDLRVTILGRGLGNFVRCDTPLDASNSGTTLRLLAGILAGHPFESTLTGDASLRRRPMRRIIEPLERMGARIQATGDRPPLVIRGGSLQGIDYSPPVASAQVKSCVLLAGLHAAGLTTVREPAATRDHTERALGAFAATIDRTDTRIAVRGGQRLQAGHFRVPGDISSAAFWAVAAAALSGSAVELIDVGLNPTRTAFLDVLRKVGALVDVDVDDERAGEPVGRVRVRCAELRPLVVKPSEVPRLIDELPALAALGAHGGEVVVTGASELRVKESDRITSLVTGLRALGVDAEELPDGFHVRGIRRPRGGTADAAGDHRLAMALAIAALGAAAPCTIEGAESVAVSYPGFFEVLASISE